MKQFLTYSPIWLGKVLQGIFICILLFTARPGFSQLILSGELRPRAELRHGYKTLLYSNQKSAFFVSQRSRLNLNYLNEKFKIGFSLQDVRVWGSTAQLNSSDDFFSVHQAWGEVLFSDRFSMKVGRQELIYDDHRIFGNVGWAQQGRSHDLALIKFNNHDVTQLHVGLAFNQEAEQLSTTNYSLNNYKTLQFLWFRNDWEAIGFSFLVLNNGMQYDEGNSDYSMRYSQTFGTHVNANVKEYMVSGSAYLQTGKDVMDSKILAYLIGIEISHAFGNGLTPAIGYEIQSGTDQAIIGGSKNNSFTPFYGTNHKFNGHMDYFYVGNHLNNVGLKDLYVRLNHKKGKLLSMITLHQFSSAARVSDPVDITFEMKRYLGFEVDFSMGYSIADKVGLNWGYSHMFGSETMEALKGGDKKAISNWAWVMMTFKPTFLNPQN